MTHNPSSTASPVAPAKCSACIGNVICQGLVPTWLLIGALAKLFDRTPALLPKPVRSVYSWIAGLVGMSSEADLTRFFDIALRSTIAIEMSLVATMLFLPRFGRGLAGLVLALFVVILTSVVISGDASCGCFGSKGPPPIVVLIVDATLLAGVLFFKPKPCPVKKMFVGVWVAAVAFSFAFAFGMPDKVVVEPVKPPANPQSQQTATPATTGAWPTPPAQLQPYYMPQFAQWVGQPLRSQPLAALIKQPLPADLEKGRWIVMFYREDCDHCHTVLENYFTVKLPAPTLLVAIPDTDPLAALPNPCSDCKVTSFIKGPEYVVGTPVLMAVENGIVKSVCEDAENKESLEATINFRAAPQPK
ncbi:MAG: hypothetical protein K8R92_04035 [Planctomycetes bacterium]|nr:hypothetical protein [Planctomycetota bacterium]